ncbi:MAG: hypothetical protein H7249_10255 [Chitinophagaceae bacterium]|nr:hypothetical protein [Oligoflexus sp.]
MAEARGEAGTQEMIPLEMVFVLCRKLRLTRNKGNGLMLMRMTLVFLFALSGRLLAESAKPDPASGLASTSARLYLVPYTHLDTQWLWTYQKTIDESLKNTLDDNFALIEKYPGYSFNFTGAFRYKLMNQYWPARYERLKHYIKTGRWHVAGSAWDETDVLIPDPESILRHILYANLFFEKEFGKTSADFMLPDSFGYPASLPTVIHHAGLLGFSTQKLSWGAARGVPFNVGLWIGADGSEVLSALNPGPYESTVPKNLFADAEWRERLLKNPQVSGHPIDFRYFGRGDSGGAPRESDVQNALEAVLHPQPGFELKMGASDQFFRDTALASYPSFPRIEGEMLLMEHSAGTLNSNSAIKIENRRSEHLAKQAELLAATATLIDGGAYPAQALRDAWETFLPAQMHDILGGTAIPEANSLSINDHLTAQNRLNSIIQHSAALITQSLDTAAAEGFAVALFNTLGFERRDLVEVDVLGSTPYAFALSPSGEQIPLQALKMMKGVTHYLFPVTMQSFESAVYTLQTAQQASPTTMQNPVKAEDHTLESDLFRVTLTAGGDIGSIWNKTLNRDELKRPVRYQFLNEFPLKYPAWNMTWKDRQRPPKSYLDSKPTIEILEQGLWRASIKVTRSAEGSSFVQIIRLTNGRPVVDIDELIVWRSKNISFKVSIAPSFSAPTAFYDMGLSVAERPINGPKLFEMPQHEWMGMMAPASDRGLSIINSCCYGADRPDANSIRMTLLYTPHSMEPEYAYNETQDWGTHILRWGIYPHTGDWRSAQTQAFAAEKNEAILAFHPAVTAKGPLGKSFSLARAIGAQIRAVKGLERDEKREPGDSPLSLVFRLQERLGKAQGFNVTMNSKVMAPTVRSVNGQELDFGTSHETESIIPAFGLRTLIVSTKPIVPQTRPISVPIKLALNAKAFTDRNRTFKADILQGKISFPSEAYPAHITDQDVDFDLRAIQASGPDSLKAKGQTFALPAQGAVHLLAFGLRDHHLKITIDGRQHEIFVPRFHGPIGDADRRMLDKNFNLLGLRPAFLKTTTSIGAHAGYSHGVRGNLTYYPNYLFHFVLPEGKVLTLPDDPEFFIVAASISKVPLNYALHAQPTGWSL